MAMLTGYFDAAGDNSGQHAVTVGGYIAPVRSWSRFRRDWRRELGPHGISEFHMTDFIAGEKEFAQWKDRPVEQMALLRKLARVIRAHAHYSPATTVLLDDWRVVNKDYMLKEYSVTPYAIAAYSTIVKAIKWVGLERRADTFLEFVFEDGDTGRGDFLRFMDWTREATRNKIDPAYPVFKPKSLEPIQAADFVCWEQRYVATKKALGNYTALRDSLAVLLKVDHSWGLIHRTKLIEYCDWLAVPKRTASAHVSQKERARWRPEPLRKKMPRV
jgi:hypothetical protein